MVYTITVNKTIPLNKKGHCVAWKLLLCLKMSICYCSLMLICAGFEQEWLWDLSPRARLVCGQEKGCHSCEGLTGSPGQSKWHFTVHSNATGWGKSQSLYVEAKRQHVCSWHCKIVLDIMWLLWLCSEWCSLQQGHSSSFRLWAKGRGLAWGKLLCIY